MALERKVPDSLTAAVREEIAESGRAPCSFGIAMSKVSAKRWDTRADLYECLARARSHLEQDLRDPVKLPELAALVGVSPFHFQRLFKEFFGQSPHEFHRQRRLEWARSKIEDGMSVLEACVEAGFQSPSSFTRLFKRHFGQSPGSVKPSRG